MTIKTANILKTIIVLVLCLGIGLGVFLLVQKEKKAAEELERKYALLESELSSLKNERNEINNELYTVSEKLEGRGYNMGSTVVMITEPNSRILDDIYPVFEEEGYTAIIAINNYYFVSNKDMLTVDEINKLTSASNYELSMIIRSNTDIELLFNQFNKVGLDNPTSAYYPNGDYKEEDIEILKSLGIKTIISYGGTPQMIDDMFVIRAFGSNAEKTKDEFMSAVNNSTPICFTIGYTNSYEMYTRSNLQSMIASFKTYSEELPCITISRAKVKYIEYLSKKSRDVDALTQRMNLLTVRLEDIRKEIVQRSEEYDGKGKNDSN